MTHRCVIFFPGGGGSFITQLNKIYTGNVENLHAHVNRNLQHANPNLHVL